MAKIALTDVTNFSNDTSSVAKVNSNNTLLEQTFENTLSRDGTGPNQMLAQLDMNSHRIINLPAPFFATDVVRLQELSTLSGGGHVSNIPAGGTSGYILAKNSNSDYDIVWEAPSSLGGPAGGDLGGTYPNPSLASVISAAGPVGSATVVPVITFDAKGRLTAVTTATIAPTLLSLSGLGANVATALAIDISSVGSVLISGGGLGTPTSGVATNLTGTAPNLTAGHVTTNANLTGVITSTGNATVIASQTGTGSKFVVDTAPTLAGLTVTGSLTATGLIANASLVNSAAATLKGNPTAGSTAPSDFTIQGLTARGAPDATNDKIIIYDNASGTLKYVTPGAIAAAATSGVATFAGTTGAITVNSSFQMVSQDLRPSSTFSLPGTLAVTGTTTLGNTTNSGTLGVTGAATFTVATHNSFVVAVGGGSWYGSATTGADRFFLGSDVTLADNFRLFSALASNNAFTFQANATIGNSAWVFNGGVTLANTLGVTGNTTLSTATVSSTLAVTGVTTLSAQLIQKGDYAYIGGFNSAGTYPSTTSPNIFAVADNFTSGGGEVDFWNTFTSATSSFNFYQQTGASAGTLLMSLSPASILSLPSGKLSVTGTAIGSLQFDIQSVNAVGSPQGVLATQGRIFGGAAAHPLTTAAPMLSISRYEAISGIDTQGGQNAALWIEAVGNNVSVDTSINSQTNALTVSATQIGLGDVVAGYFNSTQSGAAGTLPHASYGIFAQGVVTTNGASTFGAEVFASNSTGVDYTFGGGPNAIGIHVGGSGTNLSSIGVWFQSPASASRVDVGIFFDPVSTKTASILDYSTSVTSFGIHGSHTDGIDTTSGTFSGKAIKGTGYSIDGSGNISGISFIQNSPAGTSVTTDASGANISVANGSNTSVALTNGMMTVHEVTALGDVSLWLVSGATAVLVSQSNTFFENSTTTPSAGHASVAWNGSHMAVYNNRGGTSTFTIAQYKG